MPTQHYYTKQQTVMTIL